MKQLATYQRKPFLKDHPPIMQTVLLASTGTEHELLTGTVLGIKDAKYVVLTSSIDADCVLSANTIVPADGDTHALVYVHADIIANALIWADAITPAQQITALAMLRQKGIYSSEA